MKRWKQLVMLGVCVFVLTACGGGEDQKVVNKLPSSNSESTGNSQSTSDSENVSTGETLTGYIYEVENATGSKVSLTTDIEAAAVIEALGEPVSYFESASCAFNGLDKIYTYDHFRIETYPEGEKDIISMIVFLDDLTETPEGVSIGMTKADMETAYGTDHEEKKGMTVYKKDGKYLAFLLQDDVIKSIEYNSAVLDTVE